MHKGQERHDELTHNKGEGRQRSKKVVSGKGDEKKRKDYL